MPRLEIALGRLYEQDLVSIRRESGIAVRSDEHRHEPEGYGAEERKCTRRPAGGTPLRCAQPPARAKHEPRDEDQERQEADAFDDHAEARSRAPDDIPAPLRAEKQMAHQSIQAERRKEAERRIDLCLPRLPYELHGEKQQRARDQTDLTAPQSASEVIDEHDASERAQERREQERRSKRTRRLEPESQ